jgi:hypothetical protein
MVWLLLGRTPPPRAAHDATPHGTFVDHWNRGFTAVVPRDTDRAPLAHVVRAAAGQGHAWCRDGARTWRAAPAVDVLRQLRLAPACLSLRTVTPTAGDLPRLAEALHQHVSLRALVRANTLGTTRLLALLAEQGRGAAPGSPAGPAGHPLGVPYVHLRSWQLVLASADQITDEGARLAHAAVHRRRLPADHVVRQLLCLHRAAFVAERQRALLPAERPSQDRLAATAAGSDTGGTAAAHVRAIRAHRLAAQRAPRDTPVSATVVADALARAWWNVASLFLDLAERTGSVAPTQERDAPFWHALAGLRTPPGRYSTDNDGVAVAARWLEREFRTA